MNLNRPGQRPARQRREYIVLVWQAPNGTQRVVAREQDALGLFQNGLDSSQGREHEALILGVMQDDGTFAPLIRRGPAPNDIDIAEEADPSVDGPDGSCEGFGL